MKIIERKKEISLYDDVCDIIAKKSLVVSPQLMFVSKYWYNKISSLINLNGFQNYIVDYCDEKSKTNRTLAYHVYKKNGNDTKYLNHYSLYALTDLPLKKSFISVALSTTISLIYTESQNSNLLRNIVLAAFLFTSMHILRLVFSHYGYYVKPNTAYTLITTLIILSNIMSDTENR